MATETPNHKLIKPEMTDKADISMINTNWDTLDTALKHVIEESGSNTNGKYIKFSDGTMICYKTITFNYSADTVLECYWTYPSSFIANPVIPKPNFSRTAWTGTGQVSSIPSVYYPSASSDYSRVAQLLLYHAGGSSFPSDARLIANVMAVGRWK